MTNKILAVLGIVAYILSVVSSATDIDGNLKFPPVLILISEILILIFIVIATIRLWKSSKALSIFLLISFLLLYIFLVFQEMVTPAYGSPLIIFTNVAKVFHVIVFIWAIIKLLKSKSVIQDT